MRTSLLLALFVIITLFSSAAIAQDNTNASLSVMQLGKLTASDAGSSLGTPLAASGNTVVTRGTANTGSSETYVFVKPSSGWGNATESAKLAPSNGTASLYGTVGISGDTIAVTAEEADFSADFYVFVRPAGGWSGTVTETAILSAPGQGCFGNVSISGNTIATTVEGLNDDTSNACIFVKPTGGWKNTSTVDATLTFPYNGTFGPETVAISGDTVALGIAGNAYDEGTVYVYVKPSGGWSGSLLNPTATLIASNTSTTSFLGEAVAISGNTIVASANILGASRGEVLVFVRPSGGWTNATETARLLEPANGEGFGSSLAISGNQVVVGALYATVGFNQLEGAAYLYQKPAAGWKTTSIFNAELTASDGAASDAFGTTVAIGGANIFVGSPHSTQAQGAVYVFGN